MPTPSVPPSPDLSRTSAFVQPDSRKRRRVDRSMPSGDVAASGAMLAFRGREAARQRADRARLPPRRVPLGNPWRARCLTAAGSDTAGIACRLRCAGVAVCGDLTPAPRPTR